MDVLHLIPCKVVVDRLTPQDIQRIRANLSKKTGEEGGNVQAKNARSSSGSHAATKWKSSTGKPRDYTAHPPNCAASKSMDLLWKAYMMNQSPPSWAEEGRKDPSPTPSSSSSPLFRHSFCPDDRENDKIDPNRILLLTDWEEDGLPMDEILGEDWPDMLNMLVANFQPPDNDQLSENRMRDLLQMGSLVEQPLVGPSSETTDEAGHPIKLDPVNLTDALSMLAGNFQSLDNDHLQLSETAMGTLLQIADIGEQPLVGPSSPLETLDETRPPIKLDPVHLTDALSILAENFQSLDNDHLQLSENAMGALLQIASQVEQPLVGPSSETTEETGPPIKLEPATKTEVKFEIADPFDCEDILIIDISSDDELPLPS